MATGDHRPQSDQTGATKKDFTANDSSHKSHLSKQMNSRQDADNGIKSTAPDKTGMIRAIHTKQQRRQLP